MLSHRRSLADRQGDFDQRFGYVLSLHALYEHAEPEPGTGCSQKVIVKEGRTKQKTTFCKPAHPNGILNTVHGSGQIISKTEVEKVEKKATVKTGKWSKLCLKQVKQQDLSAGRGWLR